MALPSYGGAVQRRMQQVSGGNQFSMPSGTGGPSAPPNFYHIGAGQAGNPGGYPTGPQEPDRSRLYNSNFSGPMQNPYAPVDAQRNRNPYPGMTVSPTGEVTGQEPIQANYAVQAGQSSNAMPSGSAARSRDNGGGGGNPPRDPRGDGGGGGGQRETQPKGEGSSIPGSNYKDPRMKKMKGGAFRLGGRDWKGYSGEERKWLGEDASLSETLRQIIASAGDFRQQYNQGTGEIGDIFRRSMTDISREKGEALTGLTNQAASSGLMRSSGFGQELGNTTADFARQAFDARAAKTAGISDWDMQRQNFMREAEILRTQAREDALRRFATENMDVAGLIGYTP